MVNIGKFKSAVNMVKGMAGMTDNVNLDRMIRNSNDAWGFTDSAGTIDSKGFRIEAGKVKVGDISLDEFLKKSTKAQQDYLNSDVFSAKARSDMDLKLDSNFSPDFDASLAKGAPTINVAKIEIMSPDGKTVKSTKQAAFDSIMSKFSTVMKFGVVGAAGIWTLNALQELAEAQSGCFLVGPESEEEKVDANNCSCENGTTNTNAAACCTACIEGGDALLCPGQTWAGSADTVPPDYVCPAEAPQSSFGRARKQVRSSISATAARARDRAVASALRNPTSVAASASIPNGCVSCGCPSDDNQWTLCTREVSIFDALANLLASAGMMLVETASGAFDIVADGLGALTGKISQLLMIIGAAVLGVAVLVGATVLTVKLVKKKKRGKLQGGLLHDWMAY